MYMNLSRRFRRIMTDFLTDFFIFDFVLRGVKISSAI
jgi:hypothetical protein